jgi:hypothetical protein
MNLDNLKKIKTVEVPPFLFTRIQQKIKDTEKVTITNKMALVMKLSFAVMLFLNAMVFISNIAKPHTTAENYVKSMNMMPDNYLYK